MFAIVKIGGHQFKVKKDDELYVHHQEGTVGDKLEFSDVLMTSQEGKVQLTGSHKVQAEILSHLKGDKVIVFKKKRRKGYRKLKGHRQHLTKIKISDII